VKRSRRCDIWAHGLPLLFKITESITEDESSPFQIEVYKRRQIEFRYKLVAKKAYCRWSTNWFNLKDKKKYWAQRLSEVENFENLDRQDFIVFIDQPDAGFFIFSLYFSPLSATNDF